MTRFYVLGSGSAGNSAAIAADGEVLLVDAGFSAKEIARRAAAVGLDLTQLTAMVLTHEHADHTAGAARLAYSLGLPLLATPGTWDRLRPRMPKAPFQALAVMGATTWSRFRIEACPTSHDAAQPVAIAVTTPAGHRIGIAYDLGRPTAAVRYLLREAHALLIEANHDEILLRTSRYPPAVQARIAGSGGHLSNRATADLLAELLHPGLQAVVLAHLSGQCNTPAEARAAVEPVLRRTPRPPVLHVADQDVPLPPIELAPVAVQQERH
jgi:phosphoribosyl 1,2-cyclic phosphodiesterase